MAQSRIVNLLSVQRRPTQSSIEILSITRLTNHVSISGGELRDTALPDPTPFRVCLARVLSTLGDGVARAAAAGTPELVLVVACVDFVSIFVVIVAASEAAAAEPAAAAHLVD